MTEPTIAITDDEELQAAYRHDSRDDFLLFVNGIVIPSASGPQLFCDCMRDFQREDFEGIAPSLENLRDGLMPPRRKWWFERTKKSSKDNDLSLMVLWLMAFPIRPFKVQVVACDGEQAGILVHRALEILHYNPWLDEHVEIVQRMIRNRRMPRQVWTQIEASDKMGGAHGEAPELLILNELTNASAVWKVMQAHLNNAAGVPRGMVIVCTNAGIKGSPAELLKKNAEAHPERWSVRIWDKMSPWIDPEDVAEAKRADPIGAEYARLFEGRWVSGSGGGLSEAVIDAAFRLDGPAGPEPGWLYLMALDMGETHDHSGVVVVGVRPDEQRIRVCRIRGFVPSVPNDQGKLEVDEAAVEKWCLEMAREYNVGWFGYDPAAGGRFVAQRLRKAGIMTFEMTFSSPTNLTTMATAYVQVMNARVLECYKDEEGRLRRDFGKFSIEYAPPGKYKLTAVSDQYGHADVGTALVICLPRAVEMLGGMDGRLPVDAILADGNEEPLSQEEIDGLPEELREMYAVLEEEAEEYNMGREFDGW